MYRLTPQDVYALHSAEGVVFRHYRGNTTVEVINKGGDEPNRIIAAQSRITAYEGGAPLDEFQAFHYEMSAQWGEVWPTLVRRITALSALTLHWVADNNSPSIKDAGLHMDALYLQIDKENARRETYLVRSSCSLNNIARMIQLAS
jgi:hypothetical protein